MASQHQLVTVHGMFHKVAVQKLVKKSRYHYHAFLVFLLAFIFFLCILFMMY